MTWINLAQIDVLKFRRGYQPPEYHDIIKWAKDSRFMYPRVIEPISANFQDRTQLRNFINRYKGYFDLSHPISSITPYSFMPGPGEIRPTHVVFRYDTFNGSLAKQLVMKIVDPHFGHQEYRKQERLFEQGFPTPKPFLFCNYFTEVELFLKRHKENHAKKEINWFLAYLREIEMKKRLFSDLKDPSVTNHVIQLVREFLPDAADPRDRDVLEKFMDDLSGLEDGIFDNLEFKAFLFMEYKKNTVSFEQLLFDQLGGTLLERASGASTLLSPHPHPEGVDLVKDIIDIMLDLWNRRECHNDLKGEHFLYDHVAREWFLIDWGELVKGVYGRDLAVFLADSNVFVNDRCKFNLLLARKMKKDLCTVEKINGRIWQENVSFWKTFLASLAERIPGNIFRDAHRILSDRNLSFEPYLLEDYF